MMVGSAKARKGANVSASDEQYLLLVNLLHT
jgi:hypothetical protein